MVGGNQDSEDGRGMNPHLDDATLGVSQVRSEGGERRSGSVGASVTEDGRYLDWGL